MPERESARPPRSRKAGKAGLDLLAAGNPGVPVVILDQPQLGENIGFAARAMLNCGLVNMRLVAPREPWPNEKAIAAAAGATAVLDAAVLYDDVPAATGDFTRLYATTARQRGMRKPVLTAREAADEMVAVAAAEGRVGILFGCERTGLENDAISRADAIVEVPLNPEFSSLNLAQAVLLIGYEWRMAAVGGGESRLGGSEAPPATHKEIDAFFAHLEGELDAAHHFWPPEKATRMIHNLRAPFLRANLSSQEVRSLRGVIKALAGDPRPRKVEGKSDG